MSKTSKPARNGHKSSKPAIAYQSKHHLRSVECPSKPDQRVRGGLSPNDAKVVVESLRNLLVAGRGVQSILKNEARKWQVVQDTHPAHEIFFRIENLLNESLIHGEDVLVNYMGERPPVPLFTEVKTPNGHLEYQEGVG